MFAVDDVRFLNVERVGKASAFTIMRLDIDGETDGGESISWYLTGIQSLIYKKGISENESSHISRWIWDPSV